MRVCILSQERVAGEKAGSKEEREEGKTFLNIMWGSHVAWNKELDLAKCLVHSECLFIVNTGCVSVSLSRIQTNLRSMLWPRLGGFDYGVESWDRSWGESPPSSWGLVIRGLELCSSWQGEMICFWVSAFSHVLVCNVL